MARAKFLIFETWLPQFAEGKSHRLFELIGGQKPAAYQPFQFGTDYLEAAQAENSAERINIYEMFYLTKAVPHMKPSSVIIMIT